MLEPLVSVDAGEMLWGGFVVAFPLLANHNATSTITPKVIHPAPSDFVLLAVDVVFCRPA